MWGPKSAYALMSSLGSEQIINAILLDGKKTLTKAPGIGNKAASQIILDLADKIHSVKMYSNKRLEFKESLTPVVNQLEDDILEDRDFALESIDIGTGLVENTSDQSIMNDTLMACKELGFNEERIIPLAQKIMGENHISKAEQLVHLVLKEV